MLGFIINAFVLLVLIKLIADEDIEFTQLGWFSVGCTVVAIALTYGLASALGLAGLIIALVALPLIVGAGLWLVFNLDPLRAGLVGVSFVAIRFAFELGLSYVFSA